MWTFESWAVLMLLCLSLGGGIVGYLGTKVWHLKQRTQRFQRWQEDLRYKAIRVIDTEAEAAEAKRELFEAIGDLPNDFDPTMFLAVDLGTGIQRAVLFAAEQRGLVQAGTFERVFQRPMPVPPSKLLEEVAHAQTILPPAPSSAVPDDIHAMAWSLSEQEKA